MTAFQDEVRSAIHPPYNPHFTDPPLPPPFQPLTIAQTAFCVLLLLLVTDTSFLLIHLAWLHMPGVSSDLYDLGRDQGHAEFYQYAKYVWGGSLLLAAALMRRSFTCFGWALVFGYLLLDDAWWLHERMGNLISTHVQLPQIGEMPGSALGELLYAGAVATLLMLPIAAAWFLDRPYWRHMTRHLLLFFLILGGSAFGLDSLDEIFPSLDSTLLDSTEDFVELLCVSAMLWVSLRYVTGAPIEFRQIRPSPAGPAPDSI